MAGAAYVEHHDAHRHKLYDQPVEELAQLRPIAPDRSRRLGVDKGVVDALGRLPVLLLAFGHD
tara:strand:- start:141 stop:329 length:189 start_codon:yes stop_codon:yes gene_type:complete